MVMKIAYTETDGTALATGPLMGRMVETYHRDMAPYAHLSALEIFERIKHIPYVPDPKNEEVLQRPAYTMTATGAGGDCDDKAIALASWARIHGIPYRFVTIRRPDKKIYHHVFPELYISGSWIAADPTYAFNEMGRIRGPVAQATIIYQDGPPWTISQSLPRLRL